MQSTPNFGSVSGYHVGPSTSSSHIQDITISQQVTPGNSLATVISSASSPIVTDDQIRRQKNHYDDYESDDELRREISFPIDGGKP